MSDTTVAGKTQPDIVIPPGPPPKKLTIKDLEVGTGPKAKVGDIVRVEYVGLHWNGSPYSDSWTYSEPPIFRLGSHSGRHLEYGLDLAIRGMKAGGRREVIFPPDLAFWPGDPHPHFSPENTLIWVTDLLEIR